MSNTYLDNVPKDILYEILVLLKVRDIINVLGEDFHLFHKNLFHKIIKRDFDIGIKVHLIKIDKINIASYETFLDEFGAINGKIYIMKYLSVYNQIELELSSEISVYNLYKIGIPMDKIINRFSVVTKYYQSEQLNNMRFIVSMKVGVKILEFYSKLNIGIYQDNFWMISLNDDMIKNLIFFFHKLTIFDVC